jgi:NAD(P)-dependent dehydrogenase (short-subunit alcohol dehydrogenase family)
MPDQTGKIAIVTGANSGLGYESAQALIRRGAHVVIACRNQSKAAEAHAQLEACAPETSLDSIPLDLSNLDSVRAFAESFTAKYDRLDILLNNAGVMAPPRGETADGFELQFGTNHLGHFALTGRLLPTLLATPGSRVVTVSSMAHLNGRIDFDDLQREDGYSRYAAYSQSKLSNALFGRELQRRLSAAGASTISVIAHPGLSSTNLQHATAEASGSKFEGGLYDFLLNTLAQSAEMGSLPQLYAATMPDVRGGDFYGPDGFYIRGYPTTIKGSPASNDQATAERLWQVSEELTGVVYPLPAARS